MSTTPMAAALAGIALVMSLSACSTADDSADPSQAFCQSLGAVRAEVAELKSLVSSRQGTLEEIQLQRDAIGSAMRGAAADARTLADSVRAEVEAADATFEAAIRAIPADVSFSEVRLQYRAAIETWDTTVKSIPREIGCK